MMVGDVLAGRYELEELVGTGGMSSVYRAHDRVLDRRVALKVLHEHFTTTTSTSSASGARRAPSRGLSHPNIVTVIDRGEADGRQFIVFEYVDGENLKQPGRAQRPGAGRAGARAGDPGRARARVRARERPRPPRREAAERAPERDGEAKVTDFGIARSVDVKSGLTETGTVLGTSDYIAPGAGEGPAAWTRSATCTRSASCSGSCSPERRRTRARASSPWRCGTSTTRCRASRACVPTSRRGSRRRCGARWRRSRATASAR